jgi:hypothetical protein
MVSLLGPILVSAWTMLVNTLGNRARPNLHDFVVRWCHAKCLLVEAQKGEVYIQTNTWGSLLVLCKSALPDKDCNLLRGNASLLVEV